MRDKGERMNSILIVEDNVFIADRMKELIEKIDASIEVHMTGYISEALTWAKSVQISLFLLDIQLLDGSGIELAKELRQLEQYKLTPMVFVTGDPSQALHVFRETHCYDYIEKPFKVEEVIEKLTTLIKYGIQQKTERPMDTKLLIKGKGYQQEILQRHIIYIESQLKKTKIKTISEEIIVSSSTLLSFEERLPSDFIRCHKGFIVNTSYIWKIDKTERLIHLQESWGKIPFGKKYQCVLFEVEK